MINFKTALIGIALALVVCGVAVYVTRSPEGPRAEPRLGSSPDFSSPYIQFGGGATHRVTGQCFGGKTPTDAATSTLFSFQNPWSATSTLVFAAIAGINGATTTDIIVGTSTTPNPEGRAVATTSIQGNIFSMSSVTNGIQFNSVAGVTFGPGTGYRAPSSGQQYATSQRTVVLGPNEYVVGFSTSTAAATNGGITAGTLSLPTSCDYRFDIERNAAIR